MQIPPHFHADPNYIHVLTLLLLIVASSKWQIHVHVAIVVKTSQLPVLSVDHPQQYKPMLLPVKNGRLILTCKCTYYT